MSYNYSGVCFTVYKWSNPRWKAASSELWGMEQSLLLSWDFVLCVGLSQVVNDSINVGQLQVTTPTLQDWHVWRMLEQGVRQRSIEKMIDCPPPMSFFVHFSHHWPNRRCCVIFCWQEPSDSCQHGKTSTPPLKIHFFSTSLQIATFPKFHFFPFTDPCSRKCHLHTCWCVTSFCCGSRVCFTPVPLLVQTAQAQKSGKASCLVSGLYLPLMCRVQVRMLQFLFCYQR